MKIKTLFLKIFLSIFIVFSLSGCWNARELSDLPIVVGIGIDKADIPGNVLLISQIAKPGELKKPTKTEAGGEGKAYMNIISSSQTVFDAVREFTHKISNKMYIPHNQVIVFGREIAREGIQKYLDFFLRAAEPRPTTSILISKGTAEEVFDTQPQLEKLPAINIGKLVKAQGLTSHSMNVKLQELISFLISKTASAAIPLITINEEHKEKTVEIKGMAVFKGDKMVGELSGSESRGLLWIIGKVKTGAIDVPCNDGKASIEIKKVKNKVDIEINEGKVSVNIKIKVQGTLIGQTCPENLATLESLKRLEERQAQVIRNEITSVLKKARELNTDIFGFGEGVHKKYRKDWPQMEKDWDKIFPTLHVETEIECKIKATGLITKPAVPIGGQ